MTCPNCGAECGSRFCPDCGTPLAAGVWPPLGAGGAGAGAEADGPGQGASPGTEPAAAGPATGEGPPAPAPPPRGAVPAEGAGPQPAAGAPAPAGPANPVRRQPWSPMKQLLVFGALAGLAVGLIIVVVALIMVARAPAGRAGAVSVPATPRPAVNQTLDDAAGGPAGAGAGTPPAAGGEFDPQAVLDQIVICEYSYISYGTPVVVLVLQNNSPENVYITVDLSAYGALGNLQDAKSGSADGFGSGDTIVMDFWLDDDFASTSYEISVSPETYSTSAAQDLTYTLAEGRDKLLLSVGNTGDAPAQWVRATLLFFKGDRLVRHDTQYFGDSNQQLKPGRTLTREFYLSGTDTPDYDDIQVVLMGSA